MSHPDLRLIQESTAVLCDGGTDLYLTCRNAGHLIPHFLAHYRALGVEQFVIIDNGSTDTTADILRGQADISHYYTSVSYCDADDGRMWVNAFVSNAATDRWSLWADADELLVYPSSETVTLPYLTRALDRMGATGLYAFMLDFYGEALFDTVPYVAPTPFNEQAPWFDGTGYRGAYVADKDHSPKIRVWGGARHRLLDWSNAGRRPILTKLPLVKNDGTNPWVSSHAVTNRKLCGITGALLHFPFVGQTVELLRDDIQSGGRGVNQPHYEKYLSWMEGPAIDAIDPTISVRYRDSLQLVELGLIGLPRMGLRAIRETVALSMTPRECRIFMDPIREARFVAKNRFSPQLGDVFQVTEWY